MGLNASSKSWFSIDRDLLPPKILYIMYYAGLVCVLPFYPIWYHAIGLSPSQIGTLGALRPFTSLVSAPFFGGISDKFQIHKQVLLFAIAASIIGRICMTLVGSKIFVLLAVFLVFSEFCGGTITPLLDNIVLDILGPERKELYGKQRLFGTVAWGTVSFVVGAFVKWMDDPNYFFYCLVVIMSSFFFVALKFPIKSPKATAPFWNSLNLMVSSVDNFIFFVVVYMIGLAVGINGNFLFLHLKNLGGDSTLMGISLTFNCIAEVPFLFFSGYFINKLSSKGIFCLALGAFSVRFLAYSLLVDPWFVLPIELLHGITFGLYWPAAVRFAQSISPPGLGATTQGLLAATNSGLGSATGGFVGGVLFEKFGAKTLFQLASLLQLVVLILYGSYLLIVRLRQPNSSKYKMIVLADGNVEEIDEEYQREEMNTFEEDDSGSGNNYDEPEPEKVQV